MTNTLFYPKETDPMWIGSRIDKSGPEWVKVQITGAEYMACAGAEMWSSTKVGTYGSGLINTPDDPRRVERVGRLGETALAKLCGLGVDLRYHQGGDKHDFEIFGLTVDVKTSAKYCGYGLILAENEERRKIHPKCDRYVFAFVESDNRNAQQATVVIAGYCTRLSLLTRPSIPGFHGGKHRNYLIYFHELLPIGKIIQVTRKE